MPSCGKPTLAALRRPIQPIKRASFVGARIVAGSASPLALAIKGLARIPMINPKDALDLRMSVSPLAFYALFLLV